MMNVRNFHLKSNLIAFDSEEFSMNLSREIAKKEKVKIDKNLFKRSEPVQMTDPNFKQVTINCQNFDSTKSKPKPQMTILDFDPPLLANNKRTIKNRSCTLSPKKMFQKLVGANESYQVQSHHKRRFSDTRDIKKLNRKSKTRPDADHEIMNPQALRRYTADLQNGGLKPNQKTLAISKAMTKIKVFEMDNFFQWTHEKKIIHGGKNGSTFITTLPRKRKSFRTTKSTSLRERKPESVSIEKGEKKQKAFQNESLSSPQNNQKYEDFSRSIHTAASGTARRIDYDRLCYSPVSTGFFPQSSIWNRQEQFVKNVQIKPRAYKLIEKGTPTSKSNKGKDNPCRPWSPLKPEHMIHQLEEEEVFPEIRQH